jgi:phosphoglucomutase
LRTSDDQKVMKTSPLAGKPAETSMLVNVPRLITTYYTETPDAAVPAQRVDFGTSGHRGCAFEKAFNEWHILAITQAICLYREQKKIDGPLFLGMDKLSPQHVKSTELAGEKIQTVLNRAPGNGAPIGGWKVVAESGWFAARPSGTENIYKIYAESFRGAEHLRRILEEAQRLVSETLAAAPVPERGGVDSLSSPHEMTVQEAVEVWRNEGDPN